MLYNPCLIQFFLYREIVYYFYYYTLGIALASAGSSDSSFGFITKINLTSHDLQYKYFL